MTNVDGPHLTNRHSFVKFITVDSSIDAICTRELVSYDFLVGITSNNQKWSKIDSHADNHLSSSVTFAKTKNLLVALRYNFYSYLILIYNKIIFCDHLPKT